MKQKPTKKTLINKKSKTLERGNVMEAAKVIDMERFNHTRDDNCQKSEWDIIGDLFEKTMQKNALTIEYAKKLVKKVKEEVRHR